MDKENWTERDLALEAAKAEALAKFSIRGIIIDAIFDFFGISALQEYFRTQHKEWWDHLIALLIGGSYLQALIWFLKFMIAVIKTKSFWAGIAAITGPEGLKVFLRKLAQSWLFWLLIADLLYTLYQAISRYMEQNESLKHDLYHLYVTYFDAPHRDEIFEINIGKIPTRPG